MILSLTLNPCVDHTLFVDRLRIHDRNKVVRVEIDAGGKGANLSRIVAELGGDTVATGFLGGDTGRLVAQVLDRQGVRNDFLRIDCETRTNVSIESGDGPPTVFGARGPEITRFDWENLLVKVNELAGAATWVAIGGSLPPGLPDEAYAILGSLVRGRGAKWALDADGSAMESGVRAGPDVIKPNRDEAARLTGMVIDGPSAAVRAAKTLRSLLAKGGSADPVVVVSLGDQGAVMACAEGDYVGDPVKIEPKSTIGSGDSLMGALLWASCLGLSWPECLRWGIAAGTATAMTDGTQIGRKVVICRLQEKVQIRSFTG